MRRLGVLCYVARSVRGERRRGVRSGRDLDGEGSIGVVSGLGPTERFGGESFGQGEQGFFEDQQIEK